MPYARRRFHGPTNQRGTGQIAAPNWKHGRYSAESRAQRQYQRLLTHYEAFIDSVGLDDLEQFESFD